MLLVRQTEDKERLDEILKQLEANDYYCPCSLYKTKETKCMCQSFRNQMERKEPGECSCGRYILTVADNE